MKKCNVTCDVCGLEYYKKPSAIRNKNYCCRGCHAEARKVRVVTYCKHCGVRVEMKESKFRHHGFHTCSLSCKGYTRFEESSCQYRHGTKAWRLRVLKRERFNCEKCGDNSDLGMVAHHILSFRSHPELRAVVDNGACLCPDCHRDFHKAYGYYDSDGEDYLEWLNE